MKQVLLFPIVAVALFSRAHAATVLFYEFEEGTANQTANIVLDSGPNNISGTAHQVGTAALPTYRDLLTTGLQLEFTGNGSGIPSAASYIEVIDPGSSPLDLAGPLTVEATIRPAAIGQQVIVRKRGGLAGSAYILDMEPDGNISFRLQDDNTKAKSAIPLQVDRTYHVAGTWDGSVIKVFVNYGLEGQFAYNGPLVANDDKLGIGAILRNNGTVGQGFSGLIDSVRISDVALDPDEFLAIPEPGSLALLVLSAFAGWGRQHTAL